MRNRNLLMRIRCLGNPRTRDKHRIIKLILLTEAADTVQVWRIGLFFAVLVLVWGVVEFWGCDLRYTVGKNLALVTCF